MMLWIILGFFMLVSYLVGQQLKKRFRQFSEVPTSSGLSGAEVAEKMLRDNNIHDVEITCVEGQLTDHYNPQNKTINLSQDVYHGRHVAAAAVAAHETGHAVQHANSYAFLQFRTAMVPLVSLSSRLMNIIFFMAIFGAFAMSWFNFATAIYIIVGGQAVITLFSLITLPVEFDASNRALLWLDSARITRGDEYKKAKSALSWAASTYVVSTLAAISTLLYYLTMLQDD